MSETLVWVPVYNEAKHLRAALESVLAQTYTDFTLVVSDNHSTDESTYIIKEFARRDGRITTIMPPQHLAGIEHMRFCWERIHSDQRYTIHVGGHDIWEPEHLATLIARAKSVPAEEPFCIVVPQTWQINDAGVVEALYKDVMQIGQMGKPMIPQFVIAGVNSPHLFGLWNESVRSLVPMRHCCSGWDHLIVAEAALHGALLFEGRANFYLRAMKAGGDLEEYGRRHLSAETLAAGPLDFIRQLDWCVCAVGVGLADVPESAKPLYELLLTTSMAATYLALRGTNLNIVPDAMQAFNALPEVQQIFAAAKHINQQIRSLVTQCK